MPIIIKIPLALTNNSITTADSSRNIRDKWKDNDYWNHNLKCFPPGRGMFCFLILPMSGAER